MRKFTVFLGMMLVLALLLLSTPAALAQSGGVSDVEGLPPWAVGVTFGTVGIAALAGALTQLTKWALSKLGLLTEDLGSKILALWVIGLVVLALASEFFGLQEVVNPRVEGLYGIVMAILAFLEAVFGYSKLVAWRAVQPMTPR